MTVSFSIERNVVHIPFNGDNLNHESIFLRRFLILFVFPMLGIGIINDANGFLGSLMPIHEVSRIFKVISVVFSKFGGVKLILPINHEKVVC